MKEHFFEDFFKSEKDDDEPMNEIPDVPTVFNRDVWDEYGKAWSDKRLLDTEYPDENICHACKGCGEFKTEQGETKECWQDKEQGECFYRHFDYEQFGMEVENLLTK